MTRVEKNENGVKNGTGILSAELQINLIQDNKEEVVK